MKLLKNILIIIAILFSLSACDVYLDSKSVEGEFNKKYEGVEYEVLEKKDFGKVSKVGETAAYIKARDIKDDFDFTMYSVTRANAPFGVVQYFESDYLARKLEKFLAAYPAKDNSFSMTFDDKYNKGNVNINIEYTDRKSLDERIDGLKKFLTYVLKEENRLEIDLYATFAVNLVDNGAGQKNPAADYRKIDYRKFDEKIGIEDNIISILDSFRERTFKNYAIEARVLQLDNIDYPMEIIEEYVKGPVSSNKRFRVEVGGQSYEWQDLLIDSRNIMNYRTLFEVLDRTDYPGIEGNKNNYKFVGKDGKKYEFSDNFNDGSYFIEGNKVENGRLANYYMVDGKTMFFTRPNTRLLKFQQIEEITGYKIISIWEEEEAAKKNKK